MKLVLLLFVFSVASAYSDPADTAKIFMSVEEAVAAKNHARKLCLGGRGLTEIPGAAAECENLEELNVSQNELGALPEFICGMSKLVDLRANGAGIKSLPACFKNLKNLKYLDLGSNPGIDLKSVFEAVSEMDSLEELDLSFCDINTLSGAPTLTRKIKINFDGSDLPAKEIERFK